jgi:hypothetical protein
VQDGGHRPSSFGVWLLVIAGVLAWLTISAYASRGEAWDSPMYYAAGMPALALMSATFAYLQPFKPWRLALAPYAGQALAALVLSPGSLLPVGIFALALLSLPGMLVTYFAAAVRASQQIKRAKFGKKIRLSDIMAALDGAPDPGDESTAWFRQGHQPRTGNIKQPPTRR